MDTALRSRPASASNASSMTARWCMFRSMPMVRFGAISGLVVGLAVLAGGSLAFLPEAFMPLLTAAFATWLGGLVLWLVVMWKAASGDAFRIPLAADWADKLNRE